MTDTHARQYPVVEIFGPTIQGEGAMIGVPTVFVRLGGCDDRCSWCDSMHAVLPEYRPQWAKLTAIEITQQVLNLARRSITVTLSGGNPALHNCAELIAELKGAGCLPVIETQGTVAPLWFADLGHLTLSPKPPSSGNPTDFEKVLAAVRNGPRHPNGISIKVVVFDEADLKYALDIFHGIEKRSAVPVRQFVQVGNRFVLPSEGREHLREHMLDDLSTLVTRVIEAKAYNVTVLPQLHALLWGNARGV